MAALSPHHMSLLEKVLSTDFVPLLPPLLNTSKPADQQRKKISPGHSPRLHYQSSAKFCQKRPPHPLSTISTIMELTRSTTMRPLDPFHCPSKAQGVRDVQPRRGARLLPGRPQSGAKISGVQRQRPKAPDGFEDAVASCSHIELVIAHTGAGISLHAKTAVADLIADNTHGEERFKVQPPPRCKCRAANAGLGSALAREAASRGLGRGRAATARTVVQCRTLPPRSGHLRAHKPAASAGTGLC